MKICLQIKEKVDLLDNYKNKDKNKNKDINKDIANVTDIKEELYDRYGRYLLESKNMTLYDYMKKGLQTTENIITRLSDDSNVKANNIDRIEELNIDLFYIREGLKYYEE